MILSDGEIKDAVRRGDLKISRYDEKFVQPASYDVHLSEWTRWFDGNGNRLIDVAIQADYTTLRRQPFSYLLPGEFMLASTMEKVGIGTNMVGRLEGKSSLGRIGLTVHVTAGYLDPGFEGHITLEMCNLNRHPIRIYAGMPIGQISFEYMRFHAINPYGSDSASKYQGQREAPVESKFYKNFPDKTLDY